MTVFEAFPEGIIDYVFLRIVRGGIKGNYVDERFNARGIFKEKRGLTRSDNVDNAQSSSRLHIYPTEAFIGSVGGLKRLTGHGVQVNGYDYSIVGFTVGKNYKNGQVEHITLTLDPADFGDMK